MAQDKNYGRLLTERYQIADLIGEGAMGKVYRAKHTDLGMNVAVKFLSSTLLSSKMRERFEREAKISARLGQESLHIVRVIDAGLDEDEIPYYIMEFLAGDSLSELIRVNPLSVSRFINITRQICLGLEAAHKGIIFNDELCRIIHRDIKPSNIFVLPEPTLGELVKILDFGIAKLIQSDNYQTQSFMGTLAYCSPEQIEGKELDNRSDIYSLGVMMYEMLTGEMPLLPQNSSFGAWYKAHREYKPEPFDSALGLPRSIEMLVMKCLEKRKEDRPQSISEILQRLIKIQSELNISSQHPSLPRLDVASANTYVDRQSLSQRTASFSSDNNRTQQFRTSSNLDSQRSAEDRPPLKTQHTTPSIEAIFFQTTWPAEKPQQKIVFPDLMATPKGVFATLWVMLERKDIIDRVASKRYNQFLFLLHPHPMLLWITLLYNNEHGPRWLPCYLDLKTDKGQQVVTVLSQSESYRVLFFDVNGSRDCQHVMTSSIASKNRQRLKYWVNTSQLVKGSGQPQVTKNLLKQEYEKLKPKILLRLESIGTDFPSDSSN
jgi:eukaryotic-like serine/threonine-protein kinase